MQKNWFRLGDAQVGVIQLSDLVRRRNNYRRMTQSTMDALVESIKEFGFRSLVVVQRSKADPTKYEIVDGHHRVAALEKLNIQDVPVACLDNNLSKAQVDTAMISFNLSAEIVPEEFFTLVREIQQSTGEEKLAALTGIDEAFLKSLNDAVNAPPPELPDVEAPPSPQQAKQAAVKLPLSNNGKRLTALLVKQPDEVQREFAELFEKALEEYLLKKADEC